MRANFKVGDTAVYPAHGVARIVGIEKKRIMGKEMDFYVLHIVDTDTKLMVPLEQAFNNGLREIISKEEVDKIYNTLKKKEFSVESTSWSKRYRSYMKKLKSGSTLELAEVYRDLKLMKLKKDHLSFDEKRMLDQAFTQLVKELAIAEGSTEEEVKRRLETLFNQN